jgi:hypothetical protein
VGPIKQFCQLLFAILGFVFRLFNGNKKVVCIVDDVSFIVHVMFSLYCKEKSSQPQVNLVLAIYFSANE